MPFFDVPEDSELPPESRQLLEEYQRVLGTKSLPRNWTIFGGIPKIIEARFMAWKHLSQSAPFSWDARMIAVMLMTHAKRCQMCFAGARGELERLGFDEDTMNAICAHPEELPLKERDRPFVHHVLKIGTDSANLTPKDFREMERDGFSKDEILEMIGFAAYWNLNIVFSQAALAGLVEG